METLPNFTHWNVASPMQSSRSHPALLSTTRQTGAVRALYNFIARNERQLPQVPRPLARGTFFVVGTMRSSRSLSTRRT
jgi:hypothetical protein